MTQSLNSTSGDSLSKPAVITCISLRFMGSELSKSLYHIFGMSDKPYKCTIEDFLHNVDRSEHDDCSTDLY